MTVPVKALIEEIDGGFDLRILDRGSLLQKPSFDVLNGPRSRWRNVFRVFAAFHGRVPTNTVSTTAGEGTRQQCLQFINIILVESHDLFTDEGSLACSRERPCWVGDENHFLEDASEGWGSAIGLLDGRPGDKMSFVGWMQNGGSRTK